MFRRIELIEERPITEEVIRKYKEFNENPEYWAFKKGLMGLSPVSIADAWGWMNVPKKRLRKNCRFYFTEKGWDLIGRSVIKACLKEKQKYRVIAIKENSIDIFYKDDVQVAVRTKLKHKR